MAQRDHSGGTGGGSRRVVKTIDELRQRIDALDEQLVRLLNERAACALRLAR